MHNTDQSVRSSGVGVTGENVTEKWNKTLRMMRNRERKIKSR